MEGPGPQTFKDHSPTKSHHPIARFLHVSIGVISILLAMPFGLIFLMEVGRGIGLYDYTANFMVVSGSFAATAFFGVVGFRLISGRGAKAEGGLLSPIGYRLTGVVLALLAILVFFLLVSEIATEGIYLTLMVAVIPLVLFGIPSVLCFVAAARRQRTSFMRKGPA